MKIVLLVTCILTIVSIMIADFGIGSVSFGQGELVCLVWICVFCLSCLGVMFEEE